MNTGKPWGVVTPYEDSGVRVWDPHAPIPAPLALHRTLVKREWVDYNRHMSESCYLLVFGDTSDALFRFVGIGEDYRASGRSLYTVEAHIHYLREVGEGEIIVCTTQLLGVDHKRLHLWHAMYHEESGSELAEVEQMLVHVDMQAGRSAPFPAEIHERFAAIVAAHRALPRPPRVGKVMGIPKS
ncbi:MAG TPA: thioesterase family protein [Roseiflexaceae bacterium]|nr:thioesterase family protein [Roseiflexaceae bacterium]